MLSKRQIWSNNKLDEKKEIELEKKLMDVINMNWAIMIDSIMFMDLIRLVDSICICVIKSLLWIL